MDNPLNQEVKLSVTYPELRALMAKHGVIYENLGDIIENSYSTVLLKMNCNSQFKADDMVKIKKYFVNLGEDVSIDKLFFDWLIE